jgi:flagellar basal-body rod modification protein FlgD
MSGLQLNTITAAGNAAAATVASALAPKKQSTQLVPFSSMQTGASKAKANDAASGTSGTSGTSGSSSTASTGNITSDDFLTLLVSELKNQDPTQPTDPNAYITQLAQVNSLQQLIQINTGIDTLDNAVAPTTTSTTTGV